MKIYKFIFIMLIALIMVFTAFNCKQEEVAQENFSSAKLNAYQGELNITRGNSDLENLQLNSGETFNYHDQEKDNERPDIYEGDVIEFSTQDYVEFVMDFGPTLVFYDSAKIKFDSLIYEENDKGETVFKNAVISYLSEDVNASEINAPILNEGASIVIKIDKYQFIVDTVGSAIGIIKSGKTVEIEPYEGNASIQFCQSPDSCSDSVIINSGEQMEIPDSTIDSL